MKVIALKSDERRGWPYGYEFDLPEGPELDELIASGAVKIDDRTMVPPPKENGKKKK